MALTLKKIRECGIVLMFSFEYFFSVWPKLLEAVLAGQTEAAIVFGLSPWRRVMHIILPQALPIMLPGLVNQIIEIIKDNSLALAAL